MTTSEASVQVPANTAQALIENESASLNNVRWGISNSASNILSASVGVLMEPGRDSNLLQTGFGTYIHYIGISGTALLDIQFVKIQ